jgi:hypothetical protein
MMTLMNINLYTVHGSETVAVQDRSDSSQVASWSPRNAGKKALAHVERIDDLSECKGMRDRIFDLARKRSKTGGL